MLKTSHLWVVSWTNLGPLLMRDKRIRPRLWSSTLISQWTNWLRLTVKRILSLKLLRILRPKKAPSSLREREERSTSALTPTGSTMLRTCATTATTEEERPRWPLAAQPSLTTPVVCARTATWLSTTRRERTRLRIKRRPSLSKCLRFQLKCLMTSRLPPKDKSKIEATESDTFSVSFLF